MRRFLMTGVAVALALTLVPTGAGPAMAADKLVGFEGLADGAELTTQYQAQGVAFGSSASLGLPPVSTGCSPSSPVAQRASAGSGATGTGVLLTTSCGGSPEFPVYASGGAFSSFHKSLSVRVVTQQRPGGKVSGQARLLAYDYQYKLLLASPLVNPGSTASVSLTTQNIAFFVIRGFGFDPAAVDDLRFDDLAVPPNSQQIAVGLAAGSGYARVRQGGTAQVAVNVLRFNGSTGPVTLYANGLPTDLAAQSITPNPVSGSAFLTPASLNLSADSTTSTGTSHPVITAQPTSSAGSSAATTQPFQLDVVRPFTLSGPGSVSVAPCTPSSQQLTLAVESDFTDRISFETTYSPSTSGVVAKVQSDFNPMGAGVSVKIPITLTAKANAPDGVTIVTIKASAISGFSYFVNETSIAVTRSKGSISAIQVAGKSEINATTVAAPALSYPGTYLRLLGAGFCSGQRAYFGSGDGVGAALESVASNGTMAYVRVPPTATSGRLQLGTGGAAFTSGRSLKVRSYRSTRAYSFHNPSSTGGVVWSDLISLYGHGETDIKVDPCSGVTFGLVDCSINTYIPKPDALAYWIVVSTMNKSGNCYGMALSSYRLSENRKPIGPYGGPDVSNLRYDAPGLHDYIRQMHVAQTSSEALRLFIGRSGRQSATQLITTLSTAFNARHPAMITLGHGSSGHAVLAYGIQTTPSGWEVQTYNSNNEWAGTEDSDPVLHQFSLDRSVLHVTPAGWSYAMGDETWTGNFGSEGSIGAYDVGLVPDRLTLPSVAEVGASLVFSSADRAGAVTDRAGKMVRGSRQLPILGGPGSGHITTVPRGTAFRLALTGNGDPVAILPADGRTFTVSGAATGLSVPANGSSVAVTGARPGTRITASNTTKGTVRTASGEAGAAASAMSVGFSGSRAVVSSTSGGSVALTLSQVSARSTGAVRLPVLRLRAGDRAVVSTPATFTKAGKVSVTVTGKGGKRTLVLRATKVRGTVSANAMKVSVKAKKGAAVVHVRARVVAGPGVATSATLGWAVRKGAKVVRKGQVTLSAASLAALVRGATATIRIRAPKGSYRLLTSLVVAGSSAATAAPSFAGAKAQVRLRVR